MYLDKTDLLKHILEPDKKILMRQILDKILIASKQKREIVSDFLDPYEIYLSKSILNRFQEVDYFIDGGHSNFERSVIYIYPSFINEPEINAISILEFSFNNCSIEHRDVLGTLISMGIDRRKIGDIIFRDNVCNIFVKKEINDYLFFNLKKIKNANISLKEITRNEIISFEPEYTIKKIIVNSLRTDLVLSSIYGESRKATQEIISSGKLKINFKQETKPSIPIKEKDVLSLKGKGRLIVEEIAGRTKKEKYIINIKIPK